MQRNLKNKTQKPTQTKKIQTSQLKLRETHHTHTQNPTKTKQNNPPKQAS